MGGTPIRAKLISYMNQRPGLMLIPGDVAKELDETPARVSSGFGHMVSLGLVPGLERVSTGIYMYRPNGPVKAEAKAPARLFEWVGNMKDGRILVRCEAGNLYVLEEM